VHRERDPLPRQLAVPQSGVPRGQSKSARECLHWCLHPAVAPAPLWVQVDDQIGTFCLYEWFLTHQFQLWRLMEVQLPQARMDSAGALRFFQMGPCRRGLRLGLVQNEDQKQTDWRNLTREENRHA
jgi:hypothetical protein